MGCPVIDTPTVVGFVKDYQPIIASIITVTIVVIGWIINHKLTLRAQNKIFLNQLYNTARLEITSELRKYQEYLKEVNYSLSFFENIYDEKASIKFDRKWILRILEYITLFPEVKDAYGIIHSCHNKISIKCSSRLPYPDSEMVINLIDNQIGLVDDLIMYLQIRSFSEITGNPMTKMKYDDGEDRPKFIIQGRELTYVECLNEDDKIN